jgi:Lrp/AsnC family transcriptional regulator for asnA, asnC and gidA
MAKRASKPKTQKISAKTNSQASMVPKSTLNNLDKLSRRILALLQEDGRRSFSSIARELEVSEGAVRSRVNYLEEHEHLRFLAVIDPVNVGYRCWAMLGITVSNGSSPHKLALEFSKNPQAIWVGVVGGEFDLIVETWTETPEDLQQFLEDYCYANEQVGSVDTMVGMRIYKWGAPQV